MCPSSGVASYQALPPSTSILFLVNFGVSDGQLSKYCVVCEISWCRCQQALSVGTALLTIEQLLHRTLKFVTSPYEQIYSFVPPRNKSWRRHCVCDILKDETRTVVAQFSCLSHLHTGRICVKYGKCTTANCGFLKRRRFSS